MWGEQFAGPGSAYMAHNNSRVSRSGPCSPIKPNSNGPAARVDPFHVVHKVPMGDSPYVKAKHVQLVAKDPDRAIALFWAAINSGDRVDSALKDMAIVMKQQNRPQEAIEAIKSLRSRCSDQAQESLDNVLLDLFKRCGRLDDQIDLLKRKLHLIHQGMAFNGKRTKTARSQGKKFQVSVEQEATRLLGNLGWAYMQQSNFVAAEAVYRKALSIESDNNKACNLGICLMKQGRLEEAKSMLQSVTLACHDSRWASESHLKSFERAQEMLDELERGYHDGVESAPSSFAVPGCDTAAASGQGDRSSLWQPQPALPRQPRRNSRSGPELQVISQLAVVDPWLTGALLATSGFGPPPPDGGGEPQGVANSTPAVRAGGLRGVQPGPTLGEGSFQSQWWLQGGLEGEDLFDYTSPDESSDGSVDGPVGCQRDLFTAFDSVAPDDGRLGVRAEAETSTPESDGSEFSSAIRNLARSLELVRPFDRMEPVGRSPIAQSRTSTTQGDAGMAPGSDASCDDHRPPTSDGRSGIRNGHRHVGGAQGEARRGVKPLASAGTWAAPSRSTQSVFNDGWSRRDHDEKQASSPSRLLSSGIGGTQVPAGVTPGTAQPQTHPSVVISAGLPPLHSAPGKQAGGAGAAVKEKSTTASSWDLTGLTFNPSAVAFGRAGDEISAPKREVGGEDEGVRANASASEMEMRLQRRLRVFREMTPTKTLQV